MQDVAFQLERLVAGMYVYYRQCHRALKPAAIFPIEVELLGDAAMASVLPSSLSDPTEVKEGDVMILQPHDESVGEELGSPGLGKDCQTGNLLDLVSPLEGGGGRGGGGGGGGGGGLLDELLIQPGVGEAGLNSGGGGGSSGLGNGGQQPVPNLLD